MPELIVVSSLSDRLGALDRKLLASTGWQSLCPGRHRATSLTELYRWSVAESPSQGDVLGEAIETVVVAQVENFPNNLLWDQDALLGALLRAAQAANGDERLRALVEQLNRLYSLFGNRTSIRFRYVHDFAYGYDWLKWINKPEGSAKTMPFDPLFLTAIERRGHELLALIERNDARYPQLDESVSRNPFPFSRDPNDEVRLHRALAERGLIPFEAWLTDAVPKSDRPYAELRELMAQELGL